MGIAHLANRRKIRISTRDWWCRYEIALLRSSPLYAIHALYRKPNTSRRHPAHRIYPYLLRNLPITQSNHVWAADITYIPMKRGFVYLFAVIDWASRRVLSWRLSNTLTMDFCKEAVQEAINRYSAPEIFNTDQGCQFTSLDFTGLLKDNGIQISMDGKGCWRDNVFMERLWKSVKYEEVYLLAYRCTTRQAACRCKLVSCVFQTKLDTRSTANWTLIPRQTGQ